VVCFVQLLESSLCNIARDKGDLPPARAKDSPRPISAAAGKHGQARGVSRATLPLCSSHPGSTRNCTGFCTDCLHSGLTGVYWLFRRKLLEVVEEAKGRRFIIISL
jgi:hypothetical protein